MSCSALGCAKAVVGGFREASRLRRVGDEVTIVDGLLTMWCSLHESDLRMSVAAAPGAYLIHQQAEKEHQPGGNQNYSPTGLSPVDQCGRGPRVRIHTS